MPQVFAGSASYPSPSPGPVLTIGNFDGVHRGHRALLQRLVERADQGGVPACVYTFDPPPRTVLAPHLDRPRILDWTDKVRLLGECGIHQVVVERFTRAFAQHPPEWFATEVLGRRLGASALVVGYDFRFGRARAGDVELIRRVLPSLAVEQVNAFEMDGVVVSSSTVRALAQDGDVEQVATLLGRPLALRGTVVAGEQRGRTIGFPTANLETDADLVPAPGVYAVEVRVDGSPPRPAVANLGYRPTFSGKAFRIEVHILDFQGDLYGSQLEIVFVSRLRGELRFDSVAALASQIGEDVAAARARLVPRSTE